MVLLLKDDRNRTDGNKIKLLIFTFISGLICLSIPLLINYIDPILMIANYQLRAENGSLIHNLLKKQIEGPKAHIYLFNVTNGDEFLSGENDKLSLEEIGPFVFQEYRTIDDIEINIEPGIMRYTPHPRVVFLEEESIGNPEDVHLVLPNISLLAASSLISKYPFIIRQLFNMMSAGMKSNAFDRVNAYDYLWGFPDPWVNICNKIVPGLIYFNSSGLMDRFIDPGVGFRLELGTTSKDKFQVKKVTKFEEINGVKNIRKDVRYFNNSYEGAIFPAPLTPETPISIYRHSVCKSFSLKYAGTKKMDYGSEAFEYTFSNDTFNSKICYGDWCPYGLLDLSPCYLGFPFIVSKGHFLDGDPKLLEKFNGLSPNRSVHDTSLFVDPKIGLSVAAKMSAQLNLGIADVGYNSATKRLKNMFLPLCQVILLHPKLPEEAAGELRLMYIYGPYIIMSSNILCIILGIILLAISYKLILCIRNDNKMYFSTNKVENGVDENLLNKDIVVY